MASFVNSKQDIGLLRQDGSTKVGFMLAKRNGVPRYRRYDDDPLSEQRATGTAGYGWFPPGKELPIILDDFSEGISREVYDSSAPGKYFKTLNMDCRFGTPIAGLKAVTATKPTSTAPTITDAGLEAWDDANTLTNWTKSAGTITQEGTTKHGGSYSCELTETGDGASTIYQDLATTQIQGRRFTLTCWVYEDIGGKVKIGIDDGVDSTAYSAITTTTGSWVQLKVTKTLSTGATRLRIIAERTDAIENPPFIDDFAITRATLGTTTAHAHYGTGEYINFGGLLAKTQDSDGTIVGAYEFPAPILDLHVGTDGTLYVSQAATGTTIEDCEDAWNESVDADVTASLDTGDFKVGSGSCKFVLASGLTIGDVIATEVISLDNELWGSYDGISMEIKCSIATNAADLRLLLGQTGPVTTGNAEETLDVPALLANDWERVYMDLSDPVNTETIISIGLENNVDIGPCTIHIDDIRGEYRYQHIGTGGDPTKVGAGDVGPDGYADHLELVGSTMWKSLEPNRLYSSTDPSDATAWSTETTVDNAENSITELVTREGVLYVMKTDRPYYIDSNGAVQVLVDDTIAIATSDSGKHAVVWHGDLFMPWGTDSLLKYNGTSTEWIDPALYCTNLGDFDGQIQGLEGDEQWLYIVEVNSPSVEVLAGHMTASGWIWHGSLAELTLTGCEYAFISTAFEKRLYISSTEPSEALTYYKLYANYGDVTNDDNRNFPDGGELYTPQLHGEFKGDTKAFIKVTAELGHPYDADIYFECHYQIQGDTSWTDAGDFKGSGSPVDRSPTLYIPDDSSSNHPSSEWIKFKLIEKTDDATKTPVLVNLDVRAILYVTKRRIIECVVRGCDAPLNRQKQADAISASHISTVLIEADNATWPVTFYPWGYNPDNDNPIYVNFLSCDEVIEIDEESRKPEAHWYLRLLEVSLA